MTADCPAGLRILTLNTGLLRVSVAGRVLLEVPHLEERLAALGAALADEQADVICLQEVFRRRDRSRVVAALARSHPYVADHAAAWPLLGHGLLVLSRHPVRDSRFVPFHARSPWQRLLVRQGVLLATVAVPGGVGDVCVLDVHTTAGGRSGPEARSAERLRARQLEQLHALAAAQPLPAIVCGDLNAGPEASPANYGLLLARGYLDAFVEGGGAGTTWDPGNPLNTSGLFSRSPAQRIDHVLLDGRAAGLLEVEAVALVHDRPVVDVGGRRVPLSDHSGVRVELRSSDRAPRPSSR